MKLRFIRLLLDPGASGGDGGGGAGGAGGGAAGGAAGGTTTSWLDSIPQDLRDQPSLKTVPDVQTLAKNYVEAQRLIGMKRVVVPGKDATPEQRAEFFNAIGRPEKVEQYRMPKVDLPEGLSVDEAVLKKATELFHKSGITSDQADALLPFYYQLQIEQHNSGAAARTKAQAEAEASLKAEWGDKYASNLDIAKNTIRKFADDAALDQLEASGLGNHPALVKALHKIGAQLLEDRASGRGDGLNLMDATRASMELDTLKMDKNFIDALTNRGNPGHESAKKKWIELHTRATPGRTELE